MVEKTTILVAKEADRFHEGEMMIGKIDVSQIVVDSVSMGKQPSLDGNAPQAISFVDADRASAHIFFHDGWTSNHTVHFILSKYRFSHWVDNFYALEVHWLLSNLVRAFTGRDSQEELSSVFRSRTCFSSRDCQNRPS